MKRLALVFCFFAFANLSITANSSAEMLQVWSTSGVSIETSSALEFGIEYLIEVSGTYTYSTGDRFADAEFALRRYNDGSSEWLEELTGVLDQEFNLDLIVNDTPQDWLGSSNGVDYFQNTFSPDHIYRLYLVGQGLPISFKIYDSNYGWNEGFLTVKIDPVAAPVPEPVTIILLGTGLLGLAGFAGVRRKFKR